MESDFSDSENEQSVDGHLRSTALTPGADCGGARRRDHYGAVRSAMSQLQSHIKRQMDAVQHAMDRPKPHGKGEGDQDGDEEEEEQEEEQIGTSSCCCASQDQSVKRLEFRIDRLEKRLLLTEQLLRLKCQAEPKEIEFMEFFFTEMEKNQAAMEQMAQSHDHLVHRMEQIQRHWQQQQQQQAKSQRKQEQAVKAMQLLVESDQLRQEAKAINNLQQQKQLQALRDFVQEQLAECRRQTANRLVETRVALEEGVSEQRAQLESLATEHTELHQDLDMISACTRSNKKTIRVLTDEIVKIKRNSSRLPGPTDHDTQLLLDKFQLLKPAIHSASAS